MIVKYFLVILCILIAVADAGAIDCKSIDKQKFKELFEFKYGGGSKGLKFNFDFIKNTFQFKSNNCTFEIMSTKSAQIKEKNYKSQPKGSLNGLQPCTKYKVLINIKNVASKKNFDYENVVSTRPESSTKINLSLQEAKDDFAILTYKSTTADCIEQYVAVLRDENRNEVKNLTLKDKTFKFDDLSLTELYKAQIIATDDKGTKILSNEQPITKSVEMEAKDVKADSVRLEWDPNDFDIDYRLEIVDQSGNKILDNKLKDNLIDLHNLTACTKYSAKVYVDTLEIGNLVFSTEKSIPGLVEDVNFHSNSTFSTISWKHPKINPSCVVSYTVKAKNDKTVLNKIVAKTQTSITTNRLPYSRKISIHVYANYDTSDNATINSTDSEFENFNVDEFVVDTIKEFRRSPAEMQLSWGFDTSFTSSDILDYFEVFFEGTTHKTNKTLINLIIQPCHKTYTIAIRCVSKAGSIGRNVTYEMHLNDSALVLSAIDKESINVQHKNKSLVIVWQADVHEAPCIAYYEIKFAEEVFKTNKTEMEINKFDSCMPYQMTITPISESGTRGATTNYEFETKVLAPEIPSKPILSTAGNRELKIATSLSDNDKRCIGSTTLSIQFVCNNIIMEEKVKRSQTQYIVKISRLQPNTMYECIAKVKNSIGISGKSEATVFQTLQDSPQPPDEIRALAGDNDVEVKWKANNSTGYADYYHIHVKFVKFLYDFGRNCDKKVKNVTVEEATELSKKLTKLMPFSQYALKILATNSFGSSNFSDEILFNTNPSSPSAPRNPKVRLQVNDNSTISAFLTWEPPCMMNGKFSLYTITMNGQRKTSGSDKRTEACTTEEFEFHNLESGFKYDVEIQAVNQKQGSSQIFGKVAKFSFETPSGIPDAEDLKSWTLFGKTISKVDLKNIEILLKRRMLVSESVDITGITFLIFLADCDDLPQPTFGYLSSMNESLPSAQDILNCSKLYQQTDFLPNSLNYADEVKLDTLDEYTIKFVLGDEDCESLAENKKYCNGPLLYSNTNYGLMARVFTSSGFRDTEPVYFETTSNPSLFSKSTVVLVSGSFITLILVSIAVCIACYVQMKRQQKKLKKKKQSAETDENLLSFTSYCVIDKNPTPKHQFEHLL